MRRATIALGLAVLFICGTACASGGARGGRAKEGLLISFGPEGATARARPRRLALLIGIDRFQDERFQPLRHAAGDAAAMADALGEFDERIILDDPEATTRAGILSAIYELGKRIGSEQDTLLIYLSTHGSLAQRAGTDRLERYLVASDTRLDLLEATAISVDALSASVARLPSKRIALVLAACHSGRGKSRLADPLAEALAHQKGPPDLETVSEAMVVLSAAAFGETAREDDALGHDVYTHFLLEGIVEGDRDGDGAVTLSEAHDYARERTYEFTQGAQRPSSESEILGLDPIVLRGSRTAVGRPVLFSYAHSADGLLVTVDGRPKAALPGGVVVDPGEHRIGLLNAATNQTLAEASVSIAEGDRIDLAGLVPPPLRLSLFGELGAWSAGSSRAQAELLPPGLRAIVGARANDALISGVLVELRAGYFGGGTDAPGMFRTLPSHTDAGLAEIAFGYEARLGSEFSVRPRVSGGGMFAARRIRATGYSADESFGGATTSIGADLDWDTGLGVRFAAGLDAGGVVGRFDHLLRFEPTLGASIGASLPL
jgi:hypothetical protein